MSRETDEILLHYYETGDDSYLDKECMEVVNAVRDRDCKIQREWVESDTEESFLNFAIKYLEKNFGK